MSLWDFVPIRRTHWSGYSRRNSVRSAWLSGGVQLPIHGEDLTNRANVPGGMFRKLGSRLERGELSTATAERLAATPDIAKTLTPDAVAIISEVSVKWATCGLQKSAIILQRLVVAALRANGQLPESVSMRRTAYRAWVQVVTHALVECLDGRLFASARQAGTDLLRLDQEAGAVDAVPNDLFALGNLHGDPIVISVPFGPGTRRGRSVLRGERVRDKFGRGGS